MFFFYSYTDYLKSQKLKKATHTFCKTSPYLKQEFAAYKHGLQTHSFFPELQEIICEYVKISRKGKNKSLWKKINKYSISYY